MARKKSNGMELTHNYGYRLPLVEICGRRRVLIENYDSVLGYGEQEIIIKVNFGCIDIQGNNMKIRKLCKEKMVVSGEINAVVFRGSVNDGPL